MRLLKLIVAKILRYFYVKALKYKKQKLQDGIWKFVVKKKLISFYQTKKDFKQRILSEIGFYFYHKYKEDSNKTRKILDDINFRMIKINFLRNKIDIYAERAGLLIGEKGETINGLIEYLKAQNYDLKIIVHYQYDLTGLYTFGAYLDDDF